MTKAVALKQAQQLEQSHSELIRLAVQNNQDLGELEKLLTIKERYEANEAKKSYFAAMTKFKADPPKIKKNRHVKFESSKGKVSYKHATLDKVAEIINERLSKYGLSAAWKTSQENNRICVTCKITHEFGYSEETTLCAPADDSGAKNLIQQIGSTVTYLQRYTILSLTGLATSDQDDDGASAASPQKEIEMPKAKTEDHAEVIKDPGHPIPAGFEAVKAKVDLVCKSKDCGKKIPQGSECVFSSKKGYYHLDCAA